MSTSTTTTTMRSSHRTSVPVLLEAFPAPPSHIPSPNPPPTGPPSLPLPPVPGPSRISVDEQLLFLSSVVNRSRRSSRYSVASSHRDSVMSIGSSGHAGSTGVSKRASTASHLPPINPARRESVIPTRSSPRTPTFGRPTISLSLAPAPNSHLTPGEDLTRLSVSPVPLSDIEDNETEPVPQRMPSPFLDSFWRRSKHHQNESISSIDVRDILGVEVDGSDEPIGDSPTLSHPLNSPLSPPFPREASSNASTIKSFPQSDALPPHSALPHNTLSFSMVIERTYSDSSLLTAGADATASSSDSSSSPYSSTSSATSISEPNSAVSRAPTSSDLSTITSVVPSPTVRDIRLERRAERTKSAGLKKELVVRSRSKSHIGDLPQLVNPDTTRSPVLVTTATVEKDHVPRTDKMTLEELSFPSEQNNFTAELKVKGIPSKIEFPLHRGFKSEKPRTPSPDIDTILISTPRPALRKSLRSRVRSQGIVRKSIAIVSDSVTRRRASEGVLSDGRSATWNDQGTSDLKRTLNHSAQEGDYNERTSTRDDHSRAVRQEKTNDGEDSDSSIDLHTPLPHLMVRDGLLSRNSRLLPVASCPTTPLHGRSGSMMSMASTRVKSGVLKDERDTPMRRVRHRDNKMLRGGIGLTTGLGWSDSEDEDAPSPLTRRLSTLNLSRRSSASSIVTSARRQHPLSRSYSSGALLESEYEQLDDPDAEYSPVLRHPFLASASRSLVPPTSWYNKTNRSSGGTRASTSSAGSSFSQDANISDRARLLNPSKISSALRDSSGSSGDNYEPSMADERISGDVVGTSSSTSTFSIPMPKDALSSPLGLGVKLYNKEKSLPPLPKGALKKQPSKVHMGTTRIRTFSSASSVSTPSPTSANESKLPGVRPLQLPRQAARSGADRAAVPVPSVLSSFSSQSSLRAPSSHSLRVVTGTLPESSLSSAGGGILRPKPRTGTGMAYRTSSGSRIRTPILTSASGVKVVSSVERSGIPPL